MIIIIDILKSIKIINTTNDYNHKVGIEFLASYILKSNENNVIINRFKHLLFYILYHHIIQQFIFYFIGQIGFDDIHG